MYISSSSSTPFHAHYLFWHRWNLTQLEMNFLINLCSKLCCFHSLEFYPLLGKPIIWLPVWNWALFLFWIYLFFASLVILKVVMGVVPDQRPEWLKKKKKKKSITSTESCREHFMQKKGQDKGFKAGMDFAFLSYWTKT